MFAFSKYPIGLQGIIKTKGYDDIGNNPADFIIDL